MLKNMVADSVVERLISTCNLNRHEKSCSSRVKYKFPGGIYSPSLTIFEELQQTLGVTVLSELQFYPWFAVYDFESVLKPTATRRDADNQQEEEEEEEEPDCEISANSQWTTSHIPVCVSIASNVEGYREPRCIVDDDSDNLVKQMCDYLEEIQSRASELSKIHWNAVRETLQSLKNEFPTSEVTPESMDKHNSTPQLSTASDAASASSESA